MIQPEDVTNILEAWREGGYEAETINGRLRVLRTFAKDTRTPAIVESVHVLKKTVHEEEADEDQGRGLSREELHKWLGAVLKVEFRSHIWPPLLQLLAMTGLRPGEATALEWRDVDLEECAIRVRRAQWRGHVGHPKAKASRREIVITDAIASSLREMRREIQIDTGSIHVEGLVFPSPRTGGYVSNTGLRKNILRVCRAAKIDLGTRPAVYCLRHTVNNLLRTSAPELVRQSLIGHADAKMNARYSRVAIEEKRAAMGAVVALVTGETR
jgi:integrase